MKYITYALIWTAKTLRMRDSLTSLVWAAWLLAVLIMLVVLLLLSACSPALASQAQSERIGIKDGSAATSRRVKQNPPPDLRPVCWIDFSSNSRIKEGCKRVSSGGLDASSGGLGDSRGNRN